MTVSKSKFKAQALKYFREVERTGRELVVTDRGRRVIRIVPYEQDVEALLAPLRGSVLHYEGPTDPVGLEDWELLP